MADNLHQPLNIPKIQINNMFKPFFTLFIILFSFQLQAQNYIFRGVIGNNDAVLAFDLLDSNISDASYYLNKNKAVISMIGNVIDSNVFVFYQLDPNYEDTLGIMLLQMHDYMYLDGVYKTNDGLTQDMHFSWYDITKINHLYADNQLINELKVEVPFRYVYTADMTFNVPVDSVTINKFDKILIVKNLPSEIPSIGFRAASQSDKRITKFCDSLAITHVIADIDCELEYEVTLSIKRFDAKVLSILYRVQWNCGGTNADFYYQGFTFDRKTGNLISLDQLLSLENYNEASEAESKEQIIKNNEKKLRSIVSRSLINNGTICDYDNYPLFTDQNFYLTNDKLWLLPSFTKGLAECRGADKSNVKITEVSDKINPVYLELLK